MTRPATNDVQAVRRLIESIEVVHAQIAKTLVESQKIMGVAVTSENNSSQDAEIQTPGCTYTRSKSIDTIDTAQKSQLIHGKVKPKIISDERVNIQLNRFKMQQKPRAVSMTKPSDRNSWPPCTFPLHEEEMIEKLSKEILEQSKHLDKASTAFTVSNGDNEVFVLHKVPTFKDLSLKNSSSSEHEKENNVREIISIQEV